MIKLWIKYSIKKMHSFFVFYTSLPRLSVGAGDDDIFMRLVVIVRLGTLQVGSLNIL